MSEIMTVLGPKPLDALGKTLMHEHVVCGFPGWRLDNRQPKYERDEARARAIAAFEQVKDYGVATVVDPCPADLDRDAELYAEVSQATGVNLICSAGFYYEAASLSYMLRGLEIEALTEILLKEIEDGIGETGVRPGVLKIATGEGVVSAYERKMVTAAARAAKASGLPMLSHTENCTCGQDQIDIVTGEGVPVTRLVVGHSDGTDDLAYQSALAERGAFVGFDRFGIELFAPDAVRIANFKALVDKGYRDRLIMSQDYVITWKGGVPGLPLGAKARDVLPNWSLTHIFERVIPELKSRGMSDADFDAILCENPRRFFSAPV